MRRYYAVLSVTLLLLGVSCNTIGGLQSLNDEFNNPASISNWKFLDKTEMHPSKKPAVSINRNGNEQLEIVPGESLWWEGYHGTYMYKEISGDFVVSTKMTVNGRNREFPAYPNVTWQVGGILVRAPVDANEDPEQRMENWVFNTYGAGISRKYLIDIGTNNNNAYTCYPYTGRKGWIDLKIIRVGYYIVAMARAEGDGWVVYERLLRKDFPKMLQVGIMTNSSGDNYPFINLKTKYKYAEYNLSAVEFENQPDLIARFDYIRFNRPRMSIKQFEQIYDNDKMLVEYFDKL